MSYVDAGEPAIRPVPWPRDGAGDWVRPGGSTFFIAVEGPTGAGKTTLASRFSELLGATAFLDPFEENPFLARLYAASTPWEASAMGLLTELTFVALRAVQLRDIRAHLAAGDAVVADWSVVKQTAFAAATLDRADQEHLTQTCGLWLSDVAVPDLVIHLRADPATLVSRVVGRGRPMELGLTEAYFVALSAAFDAALSRCGTPVLAVDAAQLDVFNDAAVSRLADQVFNALDKQGDPL